MGNYKKIYGNGIFITKMNAKELKLAKLNATPGLVDIYTYLFSLGSDVESIANIMMSDSFNYIAKLKDGDIFNKFGKHITVKDAISFYLGENRMGIDIGVLNGLFAKLKDDQFDNVKVQAALDKARAAITDKKLAEWNNRRLQRMAEEEGFFMDESMYGDPYMDEGAYGDYNMGYDDSFEAAMELEMLMAEQGSGYQKKVIDINSLSIPQIFAVIDFLEEVKRRNINRTGNASNIKQIESDLRIVMNEILPGTEEQSTLGSSLGLNQGLRTKSYDKFKFAERFNNYINKRRLTWFDQKIKQAEAEIEWQNDQIKKNAYDTTIVSNAQQRIAELNGQIEQLKAEIQSYSPFDLYTFWGNPAQQSIWISKAEQMKVSDNILKVILGVPHFKSMFDAWYIDETALRKSSVRYNLERHIAQQVKPTHTYSIKEAEYYQVRKYVNDVLIVTWLYDSGLSLMFSEEDLKNPAVQIYDAKGDLVAAKSDILTLDTNLNIASFKRLVETWILPTLKQSAKYQGNKFIHDFIRTADKQGDGVVTYLTLPIPMMNVGSSVELTEMYKQYIQDFDAIAQDQFAGMSIADILYLYNLIVNKDSFGQKSLTRIFENLVNASRGTFLVNEYNEWLADLDRSYAEGNPKQLALTLNDVAKRIQDNVPGSSVTGDPITMVKTPDTTFELTGDYGVVDFAPKVKVDPVETTNSINKHNAIERVLDVPKRPNDSVFLLTESDWETGDFEMYTDYLNANKILLQNQKAFIHDGKLFVNMHKADITDVLHEWAHLLMARMKWSNDQKVRETYYKMIGKVLDHPDFGAIANNYPWAHGSDLQEEVLINLFQLYMQGKIYTNDNMLSKWVELLGTNQANTLAQLNEALFSGLFDFGDEGVFTDNTVAALIDQFGLDTEASFESNDYILRKHQKISDLKNKLKDNGDLTINCK